MSWTLKRQVMMSSRAKYNQVEWLPIQDKLNKEWKLRDAKKEKNKKTNIIKFKKKKTNLC